MACFYHAPGKENIRQNFWMTLTPQKPKTRGMGLPCSENCTILMSAVLTDPSVWWTDRRTNHVCYAARWKVSTTHRP